ncbi:MAG: hypothetical protein ABSC01_06680, partial [Verrucomicrobiota bacterium]
MNLMRISHIAPIVVVLTFAISLVCVHAQETATPDQSLQALTDLDVMIQAIEQTTPTPAKSLPDAGTFWSAQHAPGSPNAWPPLPSNFGLSAWLCAQLNCETNILEKWLTHLVSGFDGQQSVPGSEARLPQSPA